MNILYLSDFFPYPPDNGAKIRTYNLIRSLSKNHKVNLLSLSENLCEVADSPLDKICRTVGSVPKPNFRKTSMRSMLGFFNAVPRSLVDTKSLEMTNSIRKEIISHQYDVVIASHIPMTYYIREYNDQICKIVEEIEISTIWEPYISSAGFSRVRKQLTWAKMKGYLKTLSECFHGFTVAAEHEKKLLLTVSPKFNEAEIISNSVDTDYLNVKIPGPKPNTLIFNGALTFDANYDAMQYFSTQIFSNIQSQVPEVIMKITGATTGVNLDSILTNENITLTGYLDDIRPVVAESWACVVPLRRGGGTRLKILEAMALGTPVVTTSKGAEGLVVTHGENILIADTPQEFVTQTIRLLQNPNLRTQLAWNGRKLVEENYGWQSIGEKFVRYVESVTNKDSFLS